MVELYLSLLLLDMLWLSGLLHGEEYVAAETWSVGKMRREDTNAASIRLFISDTGGRSVFTVPQRSQARQADPSSPAFDLTWLWARV